MDTQNLVGACPEALSLINTTRFEKIDPSLVLIHEGKALYRKISSHKEIGNREKCFESCLLGMNPLKGTAITEAPRRAGVQDVTLPNFLKAGSLSRPSPSLGKARARAGSRDTAWAHCLELLRNMSVPRAITVAGGQGPGPTPVGPQVSADLSGENRK